MARRKNVISPDIPYEPDAIPIDFTEATREFIRHCRVKNLSDESIQYYRNAIRILNRLLGGIKPYEITRRHIEDAILAKKDEGTSDNAINSYIRAWRVFVRWLETENFLKNEVSSSIKLIRTEKRRIHSFTSEQVRKLLAVPDLKTFTGYRNYVMMLTLLETGCRVSELTAIKLTDINWRDRTVVLYGKGRKERIVPFQKTLARHLQGYVKQRGLLDHEYLFVNIDNEPIKVRTVQQQIREIGIAAGVHGSVRVSPHTFRHTFARLCVVNGMSPFTLREIMGHTDLETVQIYVNLFSRDIAEEHRKYSPLERLNDE